VLAHNETRFDSSSIRRVVGGRRWSGFSTQPGGGYLSDGGGGMAGSSFAAQRDSALPQYCPIGRGAGSLWVKDSAAQLIGCSPVLECRDGNPAAFASRSVRRHSRYPPGLATANGSHSGSRRP
jgi:hypothetical protein